MKRLALVAALLALAALPLWAGGSFYVNIGSQILLYAVFALGINVLVGYAGLVSLGHAGLLGIAAYAAARLLNGGYGHLAAVAFALVLTLAAAALFAALALRGSGIGFVMPPQLGAGGCVPSPRKLSAASTRMTIERLRLVWTARVGARLGKMWPPRMRRCEAPRARAAWTKS